MSSRFWRWYADRLFYRWEKTVLWDMVEPYRRPRSFTPLITVYVAAFYTGVVGSAITEQLYKNGCFDPKLMLKVGISRWNLFLLIEMDYMEGISSIVANYLPTYTEKYWEDHPGEAVPIMKPKFYWGPWRIMGGDVPK